MRDVRSEAATRIEDGGDRFACSSSHSGGPAVFQGRSGSPRQQAGSGSAVPTRRVLIVKDEALVALALEAMVRDAGHLVVGIAAQAKDAIALALSRAPEIVLMDVRLGAAGEAGIAAATEIRRQTTAAVIFVTANVVGPTLERIAAAV